MYLPKTAAGMLMAEHQLILRVIADMRERTERIDREGSADPAYVATVVDFLRTYADRCHHGKEEDILFRDLARKELDPELADAMEGLIQDHVWARATTGRLVKATARCSSGDASALGEVAGALGELADFYPVHIEKEDHGFFKPAFDVFTAAERDAMATECREFDRSLIHWKYERIADELGTG